jgi:hypothetical protein
MPKVRLLAERTTSPEEFSAGSLNTVCRRLDARTSRVLGAGIATFPIPDVYACLRVLRGKDGASRTSIRKSRRGWRRRSRHGLAHAVVTSVNRDEL